MKKINIFLLLSGLLFFTSFVRAEMNEKQILSSFFKAEGLYKDQQYEQAVDVYEEIVDAGFKSGAIYFNLGNAYYKNGDLARAILNYERAKRFIPRDSDLDFNYSYALSSVKKYGLPQDVRQKFFQLFVKRFTCDELSGVSLFLFGGLVCALLLSIQFALPKKRLYLICGVFLFVFFLNGYLFMLKAQSEKEQAIILKAVEAKFEPLQEATTHFNLSSGVKVKILEGKGLWLKIKRNDGKAGWVQNNSLEEIH